MTLRYLLAATALVAFPAAATPGLLGHYSVAEGPDVAGELVLTADGRFAYYFGAGALGEQARGRWEERGEQLCLTTEPTPVAPTFALGPRGGSGAEAPTLLVTWPNGRGIAGVTFRLGFAAGEAAEDYTQDYGWTLPEDEIRKPIWLELVEPIHDVVSPRFMLGEGERGTIVAVLTPNDIGIVDFRDACLERRGKGFVLHRTGGEMRLVKAKR